LLSPESLTLDEESRRANDKPFEGRKVKGTNDIKENFESLGAKGKGRATSPNGSDDDENGLEITFPLEPPNITSNTASTESLTLVLIPLGLTLSVSLGPSYGRRSRVLYGLNTSNI